MNAGRDVERLISTWLVEESPGRAPDRILERAADSIDRTKQRRFGVAWREPVTLSLRALTAVAAVVVIAVAAAAWLGRSSAAVGAPEPSHPVTVSSPAPSAVTLVEFRAARNAICTEFKSASPIPGHDAVKDPTGAVGELQATIARENREIERLLALQAPPGIEAEHLASIQSTRDVLALLQHEIDVIQAGTPEQAGTIDVAIGSISHLIEQYEAKYALVDCP